MRDAHRVDISFELVLMHFSNVYSNFDVFCVKEDYFTFFCCNFICIFNELQLLLQFAYSHYGNVW